MDIMLKRILDLLTEDKKSQKDLTDFLGISSNSFTNWKSGRNQSYKRYKYAIANFFNVSIDYLLGETDEKNQPLVNNDPELTDYLEELKTRDEMRMLFSVTKSCTKEQVEQAVRIIEALRGKGDEQ